MGVGVWRRRRRTFTCATTRCSCSPSFSPTALKGALSSWTRRLSFEQMLLLMFVLAPESGLPAPCQGYRLPLPRYSYSAALLPARFQDEDEDVVIVSPAPSPPHIRTSSFNTPLPSLGALLHRLQDAILVIPQGVGRIMDMMQMNEREVGGEGTAMEPMSLSVAVQPVHCMLMNVVVPIFSGVLSLFLPSDQPLSPPLARGLWCATGYSQRGPGAHDQPHQIGRGKPRANCCKGTTLEDLVI